MELTPGTISNGDPGFGERKRLLAAAPEDERVATLQPHDVEPGSAELDEHLVDPFLVDALARDHDRIVRRLGDELGRDQRIVDDRVARRRAPCPAR